MEHKKILKTFLLFLGANLIMGIFHYLIINNLLSDTLIIARNFIDFLCMPQLYLATLPLLAGYIIFYYFVNKKINMDLLTYSFLSFLVITIYFGFIGNKYYPGQSFKIFIDSIIEKYKLSQQGYVQDELKSEIRDYYALESIEEISIYLKSNKKNLIIKYQDYYSKYDLITRKEYDKIFEIGKKYDDSLTEIVYTNNGIDYAIIASSFFTYIGIDEGHGFLVWTYKDFDDDEILKKTYENNLIVNNNILSLGQELTYLLYTVKEIRTNNKTTIKRVGDKVVIDGEIEDFKWVINKDNTFQFTLEGKELDLTSNFFESPGEYKIRIEKKETNSYTPYSNDLIIQVN